MYMTVKVKMDECGVVKSYSINSVTQVIYEPGGLLIICHENRYWFAKERIISFDQIK